MVDHQHGDACNRTDSANDTEPCGLQLDGGNLVLLTAAVLVVSLVLRTWQERMPVFVFLLMVIAVRAYRHHIGRKAEARLRWNLRSIGLLIVGVFLGAGVGAVLGLCLAIVMYNICTWNPELSTAIRVGAGTGAVVGAAYPQVAIRLSSFLPT